MAFVLEEIREGIATITINRPDKRNALNAEVLKALGEILDRLAPREDVGVLLLTGAGSKAFVAGADLRDMSGLTPAEAEALAGRGQDLMNRIAGWDRPVIAAINGVALGGGCELAMACHLRIAADHAVLGQPEVKLGLIPGYGGTWRLPRLVGRGKALEMMLTGDPVDAPEALRLGLVNRVVPAEALLEECRGLAQRILAGGPRAVTALLKPTPRDLAAREESLLQERRLFAQCFEHDGSEGIAAFLEKRPPRFRPT